MKEVEHVKFDSRIDFDQFEDIVVFWITLSEPTQSNIVEQAKLADKENYDTDCFGTCVVFDITSRQFGFSPDEPGTNIFYIDNDGHRHWYAADMSWFFQRRLFSACKKVLIEKTDLYKPNRESSRDSR
jgi:hypothetical protein